MPWVRIDDQFADHPKVLAAGPLASWLYVCGLTYCARVLTDGFIPAGQVRKLADVPGAQRLAETLVRVGLWESVTGGYRIHDYHDYNPSAEKVRGERDAAKARMQRARSLDVRPNNSRTIAEQDAKFARSSDDVRAPRSHTHSPTPQTPSSFHSEGRGSEPIQRNGRAHAPPRQMGNLIALPEPWVNDTPEMAAWVKAQKMPIAWVNNRTDSFEAHYRENGTLLTIEAWFERWKKWLLDDWAKERASALTETPRR